MNNDKRKEDDWIRMSSRSRPGRFYLFNKATGQTQWLPHNSGEDSAKNPESPPKLSIKKSSKTPAQDRLKRLQHTLKASQTKTHMSYATRNSSVSKAKASKDQENELNDEPSTSSAAKKFAKLSKKETKRSHSESLSSQIDISTKRLKYSDVDAANKSHLLDSPKDNPSTSASNESQIAETSTGMYNFSKELNGNENLQNIEAKSINLNNLRSGIVKRIKEICKLPFNVHKKLADEKLPSKNNDTCGSKKTTTFKIPSKTKIGQCPTTPAKKEAIIRQITKEGLKPKVNEILTSTPKCLYTSTYPKGSANSRLERLKQSLLMKQQLDSAINNTNTSNTVPNVSTETNNNIISTSQWKDRDYTSDNSFINTSNNTANSTINDEVESMDWQPLAKDGDPTEKSTSQPTFVLEKSRKLLLQKTDENENQTMGDIIDAVNENLLRLSAEKQKDYPNNKKWHNDYYYFVLDTNVLLRDLTFVEDLSKMELCDTKGSILYIPYSVLQELDKLKMRSGFQESVKTLAVRAIKYLNSKFENNSPHLQAQSALDERHQLIDINSADDSIMNCCLQAKKHIPNLLLLTEDVNLRNKAICNNIMVSTKSDLIAKRCGSVGKT